MPEPLTDLELRQIRSGLTHVLGKIRPNEMFEDFVRVLDEIDRLKAEQSQHTRDVTGFACSHCKRTTQGRYSRQIGDEHWCIDCLQAEVVRLREEVEGLEGRVSNLQQGGPIWP